jgi:protein involved in polysaccharide export with SLBB domain
MPRAALAVGLAFASGCAAPRAFRDAGPAIQSAAYTVACPDTLDVVIADRPDASGPTAVAPDGTILLGQIGRLRVDGLNPDQIAARIAKVLKLGREAVQVRVTGCVSRQVYLCGPMAGHERAVAYEGPEPVVAFLRRTGGLSREAEPREVHVVRANVAAGRRPEVFPVDLHAILADGDGKTNVRLRPYDQVYVGETARSNWMKYLPPWLQIGRPPAGGGN